MLDGKEHARELEKKEEAELGKYALRSSERRRTVERFREKDAGPLEFRTEYHRDRDRIVWSTAFKRLQHKTQIFPHYVEDHYRRRLTHTLEVAQIATTLARALRLNEVATEAIALGHDLGHTPFGHGGEKALNDLLLDKLRERLGKKASKRQLRPADVLNTPVPLFGFDHCMQGVEQVTRVSHEYETEVGVGVGLNLSYDVRDGILKHIFDRGEKEANEKHEYLSCLKNIVRIDKFSEYGSNNGSLEAQCVWLADKLAYLLGDIEDALRARIFTYRKIEEDPLCSEIWDAYRSRRTSAEAKPHIFDMTTYLRFRRNAITAIILDAQQNAAQKIEDAGLESVEQVFAVHERLVDVSPRIRCAWNHFHKEKMQEKLYKHFEVEHCAFKAKHIVTDLFEAFYDTPELIPSEFRDRTSKVYDRLLEVDQIRLMTVRNYIAGMTDPFATEHHKRLFMSSEKASLH